jgi:hypothetical protein
MELVDQAVAYLREGFANINNPKGLLIALAATIFLGSWRALVPVAAIATIVHIVIEILAPVLAGGGGQVTLPPDMMQESFWTRALVLFLGYMIIIGVFFLIKGLVFRGGGAKAH